MLHTLVMYGVGDVEVSQDVEFTEVLDLNEDSPQFTLTCTSTGGPASSLLWIRDMEYPPEERGTILVDPATARYIHTLTVTGRQPGNYKCIVSNNKPSQDFALFTVKGKSHSFFNKLCYMGIHQCCL